MFFENLPFEDMSEVSQSVSLWRLSNSIKPTTNVLNFKNN